MRQASMRVVVGWSNSRRVRRGPHWRGSAGRLTSGAGQAGMSRSSLSTAAKKLSASMAPAAQMKMLPGV